MSSTLQCLLHVPELNNFFINIYSEQKNNLKTINKKVETEGKISDEYYEIVKNIFQLQEKLKKKNSNHKEGYHPKKFNDLISKLNPQFAKYEPNDSKDLLLYLFESMHEELNYFGDKKLKNIPNCNQLNKDDSFKFFFQVTTCLNFSIISYLFYGIMKSKTVCSECKNMFYNFQYFQFLSFPLSKYNRDYFNLYMGFKDFAKEELLTGDNKYFCQICKDFRDAKVNCKIVYTSPYLLINLDYGKNKKYQPSSIDFGIMIDLTDFVVDEFDERTYELIAVSSHIGESGKMGHFITYCRDYREKGKDWHRFNDSVHDKCEFKDIKQYSPYLLLYKKRKNMYS